MLNNELGHAATPQGIDISVKTQYLQEQSDPDNNRYVFAYTIGIGNNT